MKTEILDTVYCPICGGPARLIRAFLRSVRYKCEGGQQDGFFSIVNRGFLNRRPRRTKP